MGWRARIGFLGLALMATQALAPKAWATDFTWLYHNRPPFYVATASGAPTGQLIEKAVLFFKSAGVTYRWRQSKPKKILDAIRENKEPVCSIGWFRNPDREAYGQFSIPFHQDKGLVAMHRKGDRRISRHKTFKGLLADASLTMGVQSGYSYGGYIDGLLASETPKTAMIRRSEYFSAMLMREKIDYGVINYQMAETFATESMGSPVELVISELSDAPPGNERHVFCSRKVDPSVIAKIDAAIRDSAGD